MRLARMGSFFATRLSFMRVLVRELMTGGWTVARPIFDIDAAGYGTAVYQVSRPGRTYSLVAFSHDLPRRLRSMTASPMPGKSKDCAGTCRARRRAGIAPAISYSAAQIAACGISIMW
jgi:hypothetical protein